MNKNQMLDELFRRHPWVYRGLRQRTALEIKELYEDSLRIFGKMEVKK